MPHSCQPYGFESSILDQVDSMLAFWGSDLRCRYANRAYERWFGVDPHSLVGVSIRDLLGEPLFALNEPYIRAALAGAAQTFERVVPGPGGVSRCSLARYKPDVVDGQVVGFIAEVTDVTSLKTAQAALESSLADRERAHAVLKKRESELEIAQRVSQLGSWHWEIAADIITWSAELYRIFGRDPRKLPPSYAEHAQLYTPRSWKAVQAAVSRTIADGTPYRLELAFCRADGSQGMLEARGSAERDEDGCIVGLHGTAQDITARHKLLAIARSQYARTCLATEAAQLGIWQWRPVDDRMVWENDRACQILGVARPALPVHTQDLLADFVSCDDADLLREALQATVTDRVDLRVACRIHRRSDGHLRWAEFLGRIDTTADGELAIIGTIADVTDRTTAQLTLARVANELGELDRRKGEFLRVLGHELRNSLTPIRHGLAVIHTEPSAETTRAMHDLIERQVEHMSRLVDDLSDLRRVHSGELLLVKERTRVDRVVAMAVEMSLSATKQADNDLVLEPIAPELCVDGDAMRLAQVLGNLLDNAARFTRRGRIVVSARSDGRGWVEICVADDGIGMTPEELATIFERHAQARPCGPRPSAGLGIGLQLVKRLVEMHRGQVAVASEGLGKGSCVVVRLPAV